MVGRKPGNSPEACWHEGCLLCFGATTFYCFLAIQIIALCWLPGASLWAVLQVMVFERPSEYNQMAIIDSLPCSVASPFLQFITKVCKQPGFSFLGWFFEVCHFQWAACETKNFSFVCKSKSHVLCKESNLLILFWWALYCPEKQIRN
jgi:hypothetical protein